MKVIEKQFQSRFSAFELRPSSRGLGALVGLALVAPARACGSPAMPAIFGPELLLLLVAICMVGFTLVSALMSAAVDGVSAGASKALHRGLEFEGDLPPELPVDAGAKKAKNGAESGSQEQAATLL